MQGVLRGGLLHTILARPPHLMRWAYLLRPSRVGNSSGNFLAKREEGSGAPAQHGKQGGAQSGAAGGDRRAAQVRVRTGRGHMHSPGRGPGAARIRPLQRAASRAAGMRTLCAVRPRQGSPSRCAMRPEAVQALSTRKKSSNSASRVADWWPRRTSALAMAWPGGWWVAEGW